MRPTTSWFAAVAFLPMAFAQVPLLTQIQQRPDLSTLFVYINASKTVPTFLNSITNFTLLAPSNDAFNVFRQSPVALQPGDERMDALLMYHTLRGMLPTVSITPTQTFYPTFLTNTSFSNVTSGQVVGLASNRAGPFFVSGNKSQTTIATKDILAKGGLIHIINDVLVLPLGLVDAITQANLNTFVGILTQGGYLNPTKIVAQAVFGTDNTVFAPNVRSALTDFTAISQTRTKSQIDDIFNYHYVPSFSGYFSNLKDGQNLTTAAGVDLHVRVVGSTVFINGGRITSSNYLTANGVLHTIDTLLDPLNVTKPTADAIAAANNTNPDPNPFNPNNRNRFKNNNSSVSVAAIVGISVGGTILLLSIAALVWLHLQRRKEHERKRRPRTLMRPLTFFGGGSGWGAGAGARAAPSVSSRPPISRLRTQVKELDSESRPSTNSSSPASSHMHVHQTYYRSTDEGTVHNTSQDTMPYYGKMYGEFDLAAEEKRTLVGRNDSLGNEGTNSPSERKAPIELDAGPVPARDPESVKKRPLIEKTVEVEVTTESI